MPSFTLRGLTLTLPDAALRGTLGKALRQGRYEHLEADALLAHLTPADRVLDLGAGLGFMSALAARVVGETAVLAVEAGPETIGLARANLAANGLSGVRLLHGAVTGADLGAHAIEFGLRPAFWASSVQGRDGWPANARIVEVPALPIAKLLADHRPTVLTCDIEGSELEVLTCPLPGVRLIVLETHAKLYGPEGVDQVHRALLAQGFVVEPEGTIGKTVVYCRDPDGVKPG